MATKKINFIQKELFFLFWFLFFSIDARTVNDPKYPFHPAVNLTLTSSSLPIVVINLDAAMASKAEDRRVQASMKIIWNSSGAMNIINDTEHIDYEGKIGIKYRGNSSYASSDKKPFSVRTEDGNGSKKKESLLGMAKDEDWALLAPYNDKSLIRDMLIFDLMRGTFDYTPYGQYCEVVLNGIYQGIYILCARVRQGSNRIDIDKPTADDGMGVTGGYLLEIDRNDDPGFYSDMKVKDLRENFLNVSPFYNFKYPDLEDMTPAQTGYIKSHVAEMENAIAGAGFKDPQNGYRNYIDTTSVMNFIIAQEIAKNIDGYRLSTPLYKYPDSIDKRFKFSIWDFNISMGNADYMHGWSAEGWAFNNNRFTDGNLVPWFFKRILQDEAFYTNLKNKWREYRTDRLSDEHILATIDSLTTHLNEGHARNFSVWPRFGQYVWPQYYIASSWADEVEYLKSWLLKRTSWIDSQWLEESPNMLPNADMEAAPDKKSGEAILSEWTTSGNVGLSTLNNRSGKYALSIHSNSNAFQIITELTPGLYTLKAWVKTQQSPNAYLYLKYHNNRSGSNQLRQDIANNQDYHLIEIKDIEVTNNFAELGFVAQYAVGDVRLWVDDVEWKKQTDPSHTPVIQSDPNTFSIIADRNAMSLTIRMNAPYTTGQTVTITDMSGKRIFTAKTNTDRMTVNNVFVRNHIYIVTVGNSSKKFVF
ncbi:MAG: CotH kinase family protein [Tannerella sp.]|jgi:hypothetical protein|nr:CotH kinase family protein [Tannerella sp.]